MADLKPRRLRGHKATATCCIASVATPGLVATAGEVWLWRKFEKNQNYGVFTFYGKLVTFVLKLNRAWCSCCVFRMAAFAGLICDAKM